MTTRSVEALRAGIKALTNNRRRALEVLRLATDDDPAMADAWLGRMAAGDRSVSTLAGLSAAAPRLGHDLRGMGYQPQDLEVWFDIGYVRWTVADAASAKLAYIAALLAAGEFEQASKLLDELGPSHRVSYSRAQLMNDTERWPDVLVAVAGCDVWTGEPFLTRAASLLEGKAAANLGMFERAAGAVARAAESSVSSGDVLVRDGLYLRALIARSQGEEDSARQLLGDVASRWPDFELANKALGDPTHSLHVIDHATIDSRIDRWDPATQTTPQQRAAAEQADSARQQMADAEEEVSSMIGLDGVKQQIASLRASTIARVLRQRRGLPTPAVSRHVLMVGPPGVGKTVSARVIAKMNCGLGILRRPDVFETKKDKLTGQYVGEVEVKTRDFLDSALGATVFFDEFGDLIHSGYAHGDPIGQAIIGVLVPWMENHRDDAILIAAGYRGAVNRVLGVNDGLRGRFPTTIEFESYPPDQLIAIAESMIVRSGDSVEPEALKDVLLEPLSRFYNEHHLTEDQDVVRTIDKLGNGRFVRNIIEAAQTARNNRIVDSFGLLDVDLSDDTLGDEIPDDAISLVARDDIAVGFRQALPPGLRG